MSAFCQRVQFLQLVLTATLNRIGKRFYTVNIAHIHKISTDHNKSMRWQRFAVGKFDFDRAFQVEVNCNRQKTHTRNETATTTILKSSCKNIQSCQ